MISARFVFTAAAGLALLGAGACAPLRSYQGYVVDADLVNSVQVGVDNRQSVLATLGKPTLTSQFNEGEWYYIGRDSRNYAFNDPKAKAQTALRIRFDAQGTVSEVTRTGVEQVASINPSDKKTPTLGRERGFFEDLFGNIGTVGAPGAGGPGPDGP
ncbi:outer membrane protein assembly factor BamE [Sphingomonas sp. MG17]|jgi:outer membrane protein assembly factor BamE (lipoprotein component of BamABCDE complex)|uniref:Outer membrane protein assembly factor BamE n=1 Tax=Sphingomonas tagetis TaxID=2949092 RepID=A0A9X2HN99_9SPHN|nr:outer membrane protein assembly factor BamE [Sphingomonas tagetis]MCP3730458.1 outer membrane protein assembly factor BamE [Sphingomonas tagetis]